MKLFAVLPLVVLACGAPTKTAPKTPETSSADPGAAAKESAEAAPTSADPSAFKKLLARESGAGKKYPIKVLDGAVQFELEAGEAPEVKSASTNGGAAGARITVKGFGEDSFACTALGDTLELGATLATVSETLQFTETPTIEVGKQGAYVTVLIEGLYAAKKNPATGGTLKIGALYGAGGSILCAEGSAGYSKTFRRVMGGVFTSAKISSEKDVYSEGISIRVQGQQVGLGFSHLRKEPAGFMLYEYGFMLATGSGKWAAHSYIENSNYDVKGAVVRKVVREVLMGKPIGGAEFDRKGPSTFAYHMVREGKETQGTLQLKVPTLPLGFPAVYKKVATGKSAKFSNLRLEAEPLVEYTLSKGEGGNLIRTQGKDVSDMLLDSNGYMTKMSGSGLLFEVLGREGKLPDL